MGPDRAQIQHAAEDAEVLDVGRRVRGSPPGPGTAPRDVNSWDVRGLLEQLGPGR